MSEKPTKELIDAFDTVGRVYSRDAQSPTMRPWRWAWHRLLVRMGLRKQKPFAFTSAVIVREALLHLDNNLVTTERRRSALHNP